MLLLTKYLSLMRAQMLSFDVSDISCAFWSNNSINIRKGSKSTT